MKKLIIGTSFIFTMFCFVSFIFFPDEFAENNLILTAFVTSFGMNVILFSLDVFINKQTSKSSTQSTIVKSELSLDQLTDKVIRLNDWKLTQKSDDSIELKTPWENMYSYGNKVTIRKIFKANEVSVYSIHVKDINPLTIYEFGNTKRVSERIFKILQPQELVV